MSAYGPFLEKLFNKPDCTLIPFCAICGAPARDKHHVIQKGMGGVSAEVEALIPKIRLCGDGNLSGCHGALHQMRLHVYWEDGRDDEEPGWVFLFTAEPMNHQKCWELNRASYLPVPGWVEIRNGLPHVYGSGKVMR